jgi:putative tryptophan/tyrosine transport system substrate-binding protein
MRRREFIAGLGAVLYPLYAHGQQGDRVRRVGLLMMEDDPTGQAEVEAFREALAKLGWAERRNLDIQVRWPGGSVGLIEILAKELFALRPDVLVSRSSPTTLALKRQSGVIPIVFVNVIEPIEQGFVESLARPGGNITGFTNFDASAGGKMVQLLKEIDPRIVRVGIMYNPQTAPFGRSFVSFIDTDSAVVGVEPTGLPVQSEADIETVLSEFARQPGGGLVLIPDVFTVEHRALIFSIVARNRLPAIHSYSIDSPFRGLMAYVTDKKDVIQRAAGYVDRILRGANPSELPVQRPTRFNLIINRKAAAALGLTIPPQLSVFASEVIE